VQSGGTGRSGSGADTSRFTIRRLRSAFFLWRTSIRATDLLVTAVFLALSLGLGAYVFARARAATHLEFAQKGKDLQGRVSQKVASSLENLYTLQNFVQASGSVQRELFRTLAYPMLARNREVYSFEWLPLVREPERQKMEAASKAEHLMENGFWQLDPDGKPEPVGRRAFYVPILYMEPPSARALGFDIASDEIRWGTAGKARDSAGIAISPPFDLIESEGRKGPPAVAAYLPVYQGADPGSEDKRLTALQGFVVAILRAELLVNQAASDVDASGVGLILRDPAQPDSAALAERPADAAKLPRRPEFQLTYKVQLPDPKKEWAMDVFALPGQYQPPHRGAVEAALVGMLVSLVGLVTLTSLRTISTLRRQAEKVGPYRLITRLGKGAMGVVWEARHALLRRPTAVKLLAPGVEGERALARFEREVQLTAGLTHPSTIAIYDYGRTRDGVFYYAMELLHGINLAQLVQFDGPISAGRVVHLLRQACGALTEAHAAGLIHRDIKPQNLMLCVYGGIPDFLKVLDFGLVKEIGDVERIGAGAPGAPDANDAALSQDGSLLGTPLYMAPEGMSDPSKIDLRADLFGVGAVGYFLLTGSSPFPGRTAIEVFKLERQGPPPPLSKSAKCPVPPALEEILHRCLSFDRGDRPSSAEELDSLLEACRVEPVWTNALAKAWWQDRGRAALKAAAREHEDREERGQFLMLSSDSWGR